MNNDEEIDNNKKYILEVKGIWVRCRNGQKVDKYEAQEIKHKVKNTYKYKYE